MDFKPFPADIDRDAFGHWLSGFVDGEGFFTLGVNTHSYKHKNGIRKYVPVATPWSRFGITLRADDYAVIDLIQSYWGCGMCNFRERGRTAKTNDCPQYQIRLAKIESLANVLIPHFDMYPLFAKKRRDYAIWKEATLLIRTVQCRRSRHFMVGHGQHPKWTLDERDRFNSLSAALVSVRKYRGPTASSESVVAAPSPLPKRPIQPSFDFLETD